LRDFRRYFYNDFNLRTQYIKRKRRQKKSILNTCIAQYLESSGIGEVMKQRGLSLSSVGFVLGALIYSKHMLKIYEPLLIVSASGDGGLDPDYNDPSRIILRKKIKP
jgi:hypothetical protein